MHIDSLTLMNMKSRLDSSPTQPVSGGTLAWDATNSRYEPTPLKTISGQTITGSGDLQAGGKQAFYVVDLVATSNVTLSGSQTVDGSSTLGKKILLTGQTDPKQNGAYQDVGGVWTRISDYDTGSELYRAYFYADSGTANWNTYWRNTNASLPTVGTSNITFEYFDFQDKLVSGVNIKTVNSTSMFSGADIPTSSSPPTAKDIQLIAAENLYPGDLAFVSADGTKAARGYGAEQTGTFYGSTPGIYGAGYNAPTTYTGMDATTIPSGGSNYYYGKIYVIYLTRGIENYDRICRVYRKNGTDQLVYLQVGTMTATGPDWSGPEASFSWSAPAILGVYAVGYDRVVVHAGSNLNTTQSTYLWSGKFDATGNLTQQNYFNLDSLASTKGADICDMTLAAQYIDAGTSRFLLSIKYGTSYQTRFLSINSAGVISSSVANTTGFTSVKDLGNQILGRQVVKCLRVSDTQAYVMQVASNDYVVARSVTATGDTTFTYGGTDRSFGMSTTRLFDAVCVFGATAKIYIVSGSLYSSQANEYNVRLFSTVGGDIAPTAGTYVAVNTPLRFWGDGSSGNQSNTAGVQPTHLRIFKTGVVGTTTMLVVASRTYDNTSSSATSSDCHTYNTCLIPVTYDSGYNTFDAWSNGATFLAHVRGYDGWSQYDGLTAWLAFPSGAGLTKRALYCTHVGSGVVKETSFDVSYLRYSTSKTGTFLGVVKTKALAGSTVTVAPRGSNVTISPSSFVGVRTPTFLTAGRSMYLQEWPVLGFSNPNTGSVVATVMSNSILKLKPF